MDSGKVVCRGMRGERVGEVMGRWVKGSGCERRGGERRRVSEGEGMGGS